MWYSQAPRDIVITQLVLCTGAGGPEPEFWLILPEPEPEFVHLR